MNPNNMMVIHILDGILNGDVDEDKNVVNREATTLNEGDTLKILKMYSCLITGELLTPKNYSLTQVQQPTSRH
jgi:hypothetical protein